ncbi:MAG: holo-ACP synthase [Alphaproteobacteria bacterium]
MILGIGTDIVDIGRIDKLLAKNPERFIARTFTQEEQDLAVKRAGGGLESATYARRFAAKEACAKALGSAIRDGILFTDFSITNDEKGRPILNLQGKARERLESLTPAGHNAHIHLSLSDEPPYALAYVIIEARKVKS